ncbi:MAG: hypothetical protein ABIJ20_04565 [Nanoarchaeota archaeon]|nr:hypothetical protein [Nanoarchaeota archaeon]MBU1445316.1 hypothetical protein [Nanoarchaeota archaeon]MBU2475296.1 hypothetical protein [Nanoarchaeota archaeon]
MLLKYHFIFTLIFCIFLFQFIQWWTIAVFFSGFFIDIDHYLYYILKKRNFNLKKAYQCETKPFGRDRLHIFHTIEFYTLIFGLAIFHNFFFFILIGLSFHQLIDIVDVIIFPYKRGWRTNSIYTWINRH